MSEENKKNEEQKVTEEKQKLSIDDLMGEVEVEEVSTEEKVKKGLIIGLVSVVVIAGITFGVRKAFFSSNDKKTEDTVEVVQEVDPTKDYKKTIADLTELTENQKSEIAELKQVNNTLKSGTEITKSVVTINNAIEKTLDPFFEKLYEINVTSYPEAVEKARTEMKPLVSDEKILDYVFNGAASDRTSGQSLDTKKDGRIIASIKSVDGKNVVAQVLVPFKSNGAKSYGVFTLEVPEDGSKIQKLKYIGYLNE